MALRIVAFACLVAWAKGSSHTYPALGAYVPVSNVHEHSQINLDVKKFEAALSESPPNYTKAKDIYMYGGGESCKSETKPRTLMAFATKDLTGESFADAFYKNNPKDFYHQMIVSALDGTGDFAGMSGTKSPGKTKRVTSAKKAVMGLVTFYASHELEAAIVKAKVETTRTKAKSGHAWDEGWAFYYGTDGSTSPYTVGKKRDDNFPDGAKVVDAIVPYFNKGLHHVLPTDYSEEKATYNMNVIYSMWTVTYLRAAFKYLEIPANSYTGNEKAHAEGFAYFFAVDGWIAAHDAPCPDAAKYMRDSLAIGQTTILKERYCEAKKRMEACYPHLGIDCDMMGSWVDAKITCSDKCDVAKVTLKAGGPAATPVEGTATDVKCMAAAAEARDAAKAAATEGGDTASGATSAAAQSMAVAALLLAIN